MSKSLSKCFTCGEYYCMKCSKAENWKDFCDKECEKIEEKKKFEKFKKLIKEKYI